MGVGVADQVRRRTAASASPRTSCGPPCCTATTSPTRSGGTWSACRSPGSSAAASRTTTGTWASQVLAAPARRSTSTRAPSTAVRADPRRTRTGTWRYGTSSSCRTCCRRCAPRTTSTSRARCRSRTVDTGMGLERMASILQGVDNIYEIDTTYKILSRAAELTEQDYGTDPRSDVALRVVADHVRSAVMLIEDGVLPSQRGGRLRAAAAAAPLHAQPAAAGRRAARRRRVRDHRLHARADRGHHRRDGGAVPRAAPRRGEHPHGHRRGRGGVRGDAPHRHRDIRRRGRGDQAQARHGAVRRAGLPAP